MSSGIQQRPFTNSSLAHLTGKKTYLEWYKTSQFPHELYLSVKVTLENFFLHLNLLPQRWHQKPTKCQVTGVAGN